MGHFELLSGQGSKHIAGDGRVWAGRVSLSSGTATIDYDVDLPSGPQSGSFDNEPVVIVTGKTAGATVGLSSSGTSEATISDGSGTSTDEVNVLVVEDVDGAA